MGGEYTSEALKPDQQPVGTSLSNYAETGPYHCADCVWFRPEESGCVHPAVKADPQVRHLGNGDGRVDAQRGCCRYVRPREDDQNDDAGGGDGSTEKSWIASFLNLRIPEGEKVRR